MEGAKEIARDMLDAINVDSHGFWGAVAKGFISFPVSIGYLGYDFMDSEHHSENQDDKYRLVKLFKRTTFSQETIEAIIKPFIEDFISRIDTNKIITFAKNLSGTTAGKIIFSQLTGFNIGKVIISQGVASYTTGFAVGGILAVGAEASRAIYTSRYLRERNPAMYLKLKKIGDLDLLYYLVEDIVKPYEKACEVSDKDTDEFNRICAFFFGGL
ncbi:hypothetical protein EDF78_101259 [Rahnella sp. BIGb0236]|uniref:hypothetical protein n=1 Tax=Rahnella sp. BIGb0236 TaxID=2485117 RepID=UPI00105BCE31|nr:hypothetical protein [Rahnella sp. BIGb0236]TDS97884.1 hypothetical protein EDF78_101259 [Rahnella sp. BIGb0236]VTQ52536.1 Uncharacterised protein [Campylobacter jejuni]